MYFSTLILRKLSSLSNHINKPRANETEAKAVGRLVIELALSARTKNGLDIAFKNFQEAAVLAFNPVSPVGVGLAQIEERLQMNFVRVFGIPVFRHIVSELLTAYNQRAQI